MNLVEVMVTLLLMTIVFGAASAAFISGQRTFAAGAGSSHVQEQTRRAIRQVVADMARAGLGVNPLGSATLADEQIEGAFESALVLRSDFDGERERNLEADEYVATGNDEIVAWVLRKEGVQDSTVVTFAADLSMPRDAMLEGGSATGEESVSVGAASTDVDGLGDPPYSLWKVNFFPEGGQRARKVADNIFQMRFVYYDEAGEEIDATDLGGSDTNRAARAAIRSMSVEVIGMSSFADPSYVDGDFELAPHHRKTALLQEVAANNMGLAGRYLAPTPPLPLPVPAGLTVCYGHCNRLDVSWESVTDYHVLFVDDGSGAEERVISGASTVLEDLVPELTYTFAVAAFLNDEVGPSSGTVSSQAQHVLPENTPLLGDGGLLIGLGPAGHGLAIKWPAADSNAEALVGTCVDVDGNITTPEAPLDTALLDLAGYQVHRITVEEGALWADPEFEPLTSTLISALPGNSPSPIGPSTSYTDVLASPCQSYFYRLLPVDDCGVTGEPSAGLLEEVQWTPEEGWFPVASASLVTTEIPTMVPSPTTGEEVWEVKLEWDAVLNLQRGGEIMPGVASHYLVFRERLVAGDVVASEEFHVYETTGFKDQPLVWDSLGASVWRYSVAAVLDCHTERMGVRSESLLVPCQTDGQAFVSAPYGGQEVSRNSDAESVEILVAAQGGPWTGVDVRVVDSQGSVHADLSDGTVVIDGDYFLAWQTGGSGDGTYTLTVTAWQEECSVQLYSTSFTLVTESVEDCLVLVDTNQTPKFKNSNKTLQVNLENVCDQEIAITGLSLTWVGGPFSPNELKKIYESDSEIHDVGLDGTVAAGNSGYQATFNRPYEGYVISLGPGAKTGKIDFEFGKELKVGGSKSIFPFLLVHTTSKPEGEQVGPVIP